jgi:hypothetical protein
MQLLPSSDNQDITKIGPSRITKISQMQMQKLGASPFANSSDNQDPSKIGPNRITKISQMQMQPEKLVGASPFANSSDNQEVSATKRQLWQYEIAHSLTDDDVAVAHRASDSGSEPSFKFQCPACLDTFKASQAFAVGCSGAHRFCVDDIKRHAESRLRSNEIPTCPMCTSIQHEFSESQVTQLFGRGQLHSLFLDISIRNALANSKDVVACPTPDCKQYLVLNGSSRQQVDCPSCKAIFCSGCRELYHHRMSCAEVKVAASRWLRWQAGGRSEYLAQLRQQGLVAEEQQGSQKQVCEAVLRQQQLQRDEEWKEQHLRLCPHCRRPVERIDGCGAMVCGRDASDKGGGNRQAGCMKSFQWDTAAPYKSDMAPTDPDKPLTEAEAVWVSRTRHVRPETGAAVRCGVCQAEVVGPRLDCVHCVGGLVVCFNCEPGLQGQHAAGHVFELSLRSVAESASPPNCSTPLPNRVHAPAVSRNTPSPTAEEAALNRRVEAFFFRIIFCLFIYFCFVGNITLFFQTIPALFSYMATPSVIPLLFRFILTFASAVVIAVIYFFACVICYFIFLFLLMKL